MNTEIRFDVPGGDQLLCPRCNDPGGLHHSSVRIYSRDSEDGDGLLTTVHGNDQAPIEHRPWKDWPRFARGSSVSRVEAKGILGRRDVIEIDFWCEQGCKPSTLILMQHKGKTLLEWGADR